MGKATWVAMVSDIPLPTDLPVFSPDAVKEISAFLADTFINTTPKLQTSLLVNGNVIRLNSFARTCISKAVHGMVSSLKGCRIPKNIMLRIRDEE